MVSRQAYLFSILVRHSSLVSRSLQCTKRRCYTTERLSIVQLLRESSVANAEERKLVIKGFVTSIRKQKRVAFAAISDGSCLEPIQVVLSPAQAETLTTGAAISVTGLWKRCPIDKEQSHELRAEEVQLLGQNDAMTYPIQKKYHTPEYLRTLPHLRTRTAHNALLLRLRSQVIADLTSYFSQKGFVQSHTPIITSSDCEGAGEVFTVESNTSKTHVHASKTCSPDNFFREVKYLTVSSQLHLEALAQSVGNVWTLSPTFRAEKSDTARHLSEFYMLEVEMAFVDRHEQVMDLAEDMVRSVATRLRASSVGQELQSKRLVPGNNGEEGRSSTSIRPEDLLQRWEGLIQGPWPRITYHDAIARLQEVATSGQVAFEFPPDAADGLQAEHEKFLAEDIGRKGPVFVTDYPRSMKPFYMAPSSATSNEPRTYDTVACFDLLLPDVCEVVGGSMREHRLDVLMETMLERGLLKGNRAHLGQPGSIVTQQSAGLDWYLDLRRFGSVPHGGFGLGFDRLLAYLAGVANIREIATFPRWYGRCAC